MKIINKQEVFKAKQALNSFLNKNPHMKPFQIEIENRLNKIGNNRENRIAILHTLLMEKLHELNEALQLLVCLDGEKL